MYIGQITMDDPIELTPEMVDFYNQQRQAKITVPGTSIPVDIKPAQTAMLNTLYAVVVVAVLLYLMRSK